MQLKNHIYTNLFELESFIKNKIIPIESSSILIQIFSTTLEEKKLKSVLKTIKSLLPSANIVGSSTANCTCIDNNIINNLVISFSIFQKSFVRTTYVKSLNISNAIKISKEFINEDTKVLMLFNSDSKNSIETFLEGLRFDLKNSTLVGGNAATSFDYLKPFILEDETIIKQGLVLVAIDSKELIVSNNFAFNWSKVGKEMTITKVNNNRVYEIDNMPILKLYQKYFGKDLNSNLTESLISFPLVKTVLGVDVARSVINVEDDNSFVFAGSFEKGDKVRFAIGNIDEVYNDSVRLQTQLASNPVEAIYFYSYKLRDQFLGNNLKTELESISQVASNIGFFTQGEFFQIGKKVVQLNITTTTLTLSENNQLRRFSSCPIKSNKYSSLKALINLVNTVQEELDENINYLNQYKNAIDKHTIVSKTNKKGIITEVNSKFCEISGYSQEELLGKPHNIVRHPDFPKDVFRKMWKTIQKKEIFQGIIKNMTKSKKPYFVDTVVKPILDKNGNIVEYLGLRHDITAFVNQKVQLKDEIKTIKHPFLVMIKIEDFEILKDFYNEEIIHQIEDKFFEEALNFLPSKSGYKKVYFLGDGEYALLKELQSFEKSSIEYETTVLKKFQANVKRATLLFENFEFNISIILSISTDKKICYEEAKQGLKSLLRTKKDFIYVQGLTSNLSEIAKNNIETIKMIKTAIENKNIVSYFQPIYNNKTKKVEKYESLVRLITQDNQIVSPFFFIDIAKKGRYYKQITNIVIENSFEAMKKLQMDVTINISVVDIEDDLIREKIYSKLKECKILASKVTFELLEDENIKDFSIVKEFIKNVKEFGSNIAIDDFGSGYSNFERLLDFEPTILKIDGSLIKNILKDSISRNIVEAIIVFAKKEGLKTVAEFVSSKEIFDLVNELDIDYCQGYYINKPKALDEIL
ncbi:hypothetical protein CP960_12705 [Malaciobacter halophilus]|uniref:Diguanylate cyclase n=1 Tax=Malaciobacter halophilus TaxID=197482 RepID=A0A2N1IZS5_9BACT|nr:EAL domain-containing protein [Malaciobacter halophilus]AXH09661.1 multi-sensor domain-containing diguanylate phosphodiesterase [Malaciobacter halophilus]PKI79796.1 hypothetical protein CP960_12705 [Malaciobacter halophilus]